MLKSNTFHFPIFSRKYVSILNSMEVHKSVLSPRLFSFHNFCFELISLDDVNHNKIEVACVMFDH